MRSVPILAVAALLSGLVAAAEPARAAGPTTGLYESFRTTPVGVTKHGLVVGEDGTMIDRKGRTSQVRRPADAESLVLRDATADGRVVGSAVLTDTLSSTIVWESPTAVAEVLPPPPGAAISYGLGVDGDGSVLVGEHENWAAEWLWTGESYTSILEHTGGDLQSAHEVNARGDLVGERYDPSSETPLFLWRDGRATALQRPAECGLPLTVTSLADDGTVGGYCAVMGADKAVTWDRAGRPRLLPLLPDVPSDFARGRVLDVANHDYAVGFVGYYRSWTDDVVPAVWRRGRLTLLGDLGRRVNAVAVNSKGTVAGRDDLDRLTVWSTR